MAVAEDRRRIAYASGRSCRSARSSCLPRWRSASGSCRSSSTSKYEEMAENNHQRTLALRAPRGVLFDRNGKVLVENRHSFTISIVREHTKDLDRTMRLLAERGRPRPEAGAADRRSASRRADATGRSWSSRTRRWRRWRRSRRGGSTSSCPTSSSRKCRRGKYPTDALAAHLFGYVGEASDAQLGDGVDAGRDHRPVRASRRSTTSC